MEINQMIMSIMVGYLFGREIRRDWIAFREARRRSKLN